MLTFVLKIVIVIAVVLIILYSVVSYRISEKKNNKDKKDESYTAYRERATKATILALSLDSRLSQLKKTLESLPRDGTDKRKFARSKVIHALFVHCHDKQIFHGTIFLIEDEAKNEVQTRK